MEIKDMQTRSSIKCLLQSLVLALLFTLLSTPVVDAEDTENWAFASIPNYLLKVDGEETAGALFYLAQAQGYLIIATEALPAPVLLRFREQDVSLLGEELPEERPDGSFDLPSGAKLAPQGKIEQDPADGMPLFTVGEKQGRIEPAKTVSGVYGLAALKEKMPVYAKRATAYQLDENIMKELRASGREALVRIYFGSWCSRCADYLPRFLQVNGALDESSIRVEYHGMEREPPPEIKALNINMLPGGIVFSPDGEKELGRFSGAGWEKPEKALRDVLLGEVAPGETSE